MEAAEEKNMTLIDAVIGGLITGFVTMAVVVLNEWLFKKRLTKMLEDFEEKIKVKMNGKKT